MGRSYTIHCLGYAPLNRKEKRVFTAMNKREIAWRRIEASREGLKIKYWYAQTKTGEKILGGLIKKDEEVRVPKLVECICGGRGYYVENNEKYRCPVCEGTGQTTKGYWNNWTNWQIERFKK